jgi:hypothetical protein
MGTCRAATCTDGVKNGGESDLDCGGAAGCPRCGEGKDCALPGDCLSSQCVTTKCTQPPLFSTPVQLPVGTGPWDVAVADLDGDGKQDIAVSNQGSYDVSVAFGNGDGTFTSVAALAVAGNGSGPQGLLLTDVNGDGKKDVVTGRAMSGPGGWGGGRFTLARNFGARAFLSPVDYDYYTGAWAGGGGGVAVGDFNGDGRVDFATGDTDISNYVTNPDARGGYWWFGTADGGVAAGGELPAAGTAMASADFNRDGHTDVVGHSPGRGTATVFLGFTPGMDGGGGLTLSATVGVSAGGGTIVTGLINPDMNPDFAVTANSASRVSICLGVGDGTFLSPATYAVTAPYGLVLSDVTRDGIPDLVVGSSGIGVLAGLDGGTFGAASYYQSAALGAVGRIAVGDFNGDGKPDVVAIAGGKAWVLLNLSP